MRLFRRKYFAENEFVRLKQSYSIDGNVDNGFVNTIVYNIYDKNNHKVGYCDLRLGMNEELYYLGQIGYHIYPRYRGRHLAYHATCLLFEIAKNKYMQERLLITCNPDNLASYKTLQRLNGKLLGVFKVPKDHYCYQMGDFEKCIFVYDL